MPSPDPLTPQERLAISRQALLKHMSRHRRAHDDQTDGQSDAGALPPGPTPSGAWSLITSAARAWWHRHPASLVAELARPLLDDYAQAHPFKLLGFSAGAGAAIVVIRPWRMVSMGVLLTALKSSGLSTAALSNLSRTARPPPPGPP